MADEEPIEGEYELIPHKEIRELKEELQKLREFPAGPGTKLQISLDELSKKTDRMIEIFDEAFHEITTEEGGLSFKEKMQPLTDKMNKVLEQNAEIASGIVALADIMTELKGQLGHVQPKPIMRPPIPTNTGPSMPTTNGPPMIPRPPGVPTHGFPRPPGPPRPQGMPPPPPKR